jgi:putative transcriptional regulator
VKNRILALMGEKQAKENRSINQTDVAEATGLTRAAISKWARGEITQFNSETIERLCKYFNCGIGDLLYIEEEGATEKEPA